MALDARACVEPRGAGLQRPAMGICICLNMLGGHGVGHAAWHPLRRDPEAATHAWRGGPCTPPGRQRPCLPCLASKCALVLLVSPVPFTTALPPPPLHAPVPGLAPSPPSRHPHLCHPASIPLLPYGPLHIPPTVPRVLPSPQTPVLAATPPPPPPATTPCCSAPPRIHAPCSPAPDTASPLWRRVGAGPVPPAAGPGGGGAGGPGGRAAHPPRHDVHRKAGQGPKAAAQPMTEARQGPEAAAQSMTKAVLPARAAERAWQPASSGCTSWNGKRWRRGGGSLEQAWYGM